MFMVNFEYFLNWWRFTRFIPWHENWHTHHTHQRMQWCHNFKYEVLDGELCIYTAHFCTASKTVCLCDLSLDYWPPKVAPSYTNESSTSSKKACSITLRESLNKRKLFIKSCSFWDFRLYEHRNQKIRIFDESSYW